MTFIDYIMWAAERLSFKKYRELIGTSWKKKLKKGLP